MPERLRGVFTTRRYTNTRLPLPLPRCRVGLNWLWPKVEDWNWETIFADIVSLYSTTVTYLASKAIEFGEKRKNSY